MVNNHNLPFHSSVALLCEGVAPPLIALHVKKIPLPLFFSIFSLHFYNLVFTIMMILVLVIKNHVISVKELYSIIAIVPNHHHSEIGGVATNCNHCHHVGVCLWGKLVQLPSTLLWFDYLLIFLEILNFIVLIRKILVVIAYNIVSF